MGAQVQDALEGGQGRWRPRRSQGAIWGGGGDDLSHSGRLLWVQVGRMGVN